MASQSHQLMQYSGKNTCTYHSLSLLAGNSALAFRKSEIDV